MTKLLRATTFKINFKSSEAKNTISSTYTVLYVSVQKCIDKPVVKVWPDCSIYICNMTYSVTTQLKVYRLLFTINS